MTATFAELWRSFDVIHYPNYISDIHTDVAFQGPAIWLYSHESIDIESIPFETQLACSERYPSR